MSLVATHNDSDPAHWQDENDLYVVSDLHLADGQISPFGKYTRGENFFWDEAFGRFLEHTGNASQGRSQTLVINGDFLDFLRVDRVPSRADPADAARVQQWMAFLQEIGHPAASGDLYGADKSEAKYGFKTDDFKSVWKLLLIADGHKVFFEALARFAMLGNNRVVVVKGNHDLEFHWEPVRQALVYVLAGRNAQMYPRVNERIHFCQQSVVINNQLYIEHGHRFESITWSYPDTLPGTPTELFLSVGSLFNRYVINKIEQIEPLFDNIVPPTDILKTVALHYPTKVWEIVSKHFIGAWKIVRKHHLRFAARIMGSILGIGLPVLVFLVLLALLYFKLLNEMTDSAGKWFLNIGGSLLGALAVRWLQKILVGTGSSTSLVADTEAILRQNASLTVVSFGHTHASEMCMCPGGTCWYVNTGTWIPVLEIRTNKVQDINTFCVLRLINQNGTLRREPLLRWNDSRNELERLIYFEKA